jgi:GTP cyclohydrolase I
LLTAIGEDPQREGLRETPRRIAQALEFLTSGYKQNPEEIIGDACFTEETNNMVIIRDIELYSLCEHHMLPFFGRCHVGYIPRDQVPGCSKIARIVDMYARRLQIQERLTEQIAHAVQDAIGAAGVGVMIEARHLCMMMRGVQKQNSLFVTSSLFGDFRTLPDTRHEFMSILSKERI